MGFGYNVNRSATLERQKMHSVLLALWMLLCPIAPATAQVSVGIALPGVNIGINLAGYPNLVPVPGYPVYYAPQVNSNYFFYDGMYWIYQQDNWYASSWYNGPWGLVAPEAVPLFVLRVPVRYYRQPPAYFRGWSQNAPPRWGEHWGNAWEQGRPGWNTWNHSAVPAPAPLPVYQKQYSGSRYPRVEQQQALQNQNYRYQSRDNEVQQHPPGQRVQGAPPPAPQGRQAVSAEKSPTAQNQRGAGQPGSSHQGSPQAMRTGAGPGHGPTASQTLPTQTAAPAQPQKQPPPQTAIKREQPAAGPPGQEKGPRGKTASEEPKQGQEKGRDKSD
jgi:hypothetical protein